MRVASYSLALFTAAILMLPKVAVTSEHRDETSSYKRSEKPSESIKKDTDKGKEKKAEKKVRAIVKGSPTDTHTASAGTPEEVMKQLLAGNKRHMAYKYANPHRNQQCRLQNAKGQKPVAIVLSCSDSRVPPEIVFDQGIGDLFVVRTAGHVVDSVTLGSMEYAVEHLGVRLIVVMGHEKCGAVDATLKGGEAPGNIKSVIEAIKPAVEKTKAKQSHSHDCDTLCSSVKMNVKQQIEIIKKSSPILAEFIQDGVLKIVGSYYDLKTGEVQLTFIPSLI